MEYQILVWFSFDFLAKPIIFAIERTNFWLNKNYPNQRNFGEGR